MNTKAQSKRAQQISASDPPRPLNREEMVGWFDPRQLLATAQQVVISSIIGRHADRRLIENLATQAFYFDFTTPPPQDEAVINALMEEAKEKAKKGEFLEQVPLARDAENDLWIDYVSDVGDGWNSTYAVAHQLAQPQLSLPGSNEPLKRGDILIFGGDEVYPTANRDQYHGRWESPYGEAFAAAPTTFPYAFAIPGNHDWYDSLASFSEKFSGSYVRTFPKEAEKAAQKGKPQGGWLTPQNRSYFALKLPRDWWLFGVDLQLNHDIDEAQLTYFEKAMRQLEHDEGVGGGQTRVILCSPEPFWVYTKIYKDVENDYEKSRLRELVRDVIGESRIAVYLAGDLHHYYRIKELKDPGKNDGVLRITAGGGGAFLHPTHGNEGQAFAADEEYEVHAYPDPKISRRLIWGNWFFLYKNPWFGLVTGPLYLLTAWFLLAGIGDERRKLLVDEALKIWRPDEATLRVALQAGWTMWDGAFFNSPFLSFLCLAVVLGFVAFTDVRAKTADRWLLGVQHGVLHLGSAGLIGWLGCVVFAGVEQVTKWVGLADWIGNGTAWIVAILWTFLAGAVVGSTIMGIYLWFSLNVLGYHTGEGSSLKVEGYKNFLRMKLAKDGSLTIYAIGLNSTPRWSDDSEKNEWEPATPNDQQPSCFRPRSDLPEEKLEDFRPRLIDSPLKYALK